MVVFARKSPIIFRSIIVSPTLNQMLAVDTPSGGDTTLHYPIPQGSTNPNNAGGSSPLYLNNPTNIQNTVTYDPTTNQYIFQNKVGEMNNGIPYYMSLEEYMKYDLQKSMDDYWDSRAKTNAMSGGSSMIPKINIPSKAFSTIFGSNTIDIRPQGSAELIFGVLSSKREDPNLNVKQQRSTNFNFEEKIQMNVRAKVGDKIDFGINYNTEASFEFDNKMKLAYQGDEDEILQLVEAGDINFPLSGTLITGSQTLFGLKTKWKFGKATVTAVFSQQKSESKNITVAGGAQTSEFYIKADEYEENKHFFLGQYFRDNYNKALSTLPAINSSVNISKIEVWVTTVGAPVDQNRNVVAFQDLAEQNPHRNDIIHGNSNIYPSNKSNDLLQNIDINQIRNIDAVSSYLSGSPWAFVSGTDYEKVESARRLGAMEYTFNSRLGFISLNTRLNSDQVLAVAYQYTVVGDTTVYKVGEFSDEGITVPNNLVVKLLKSTTLNPKIPMWNLMMKNVYTIGAYQVNPQDFRLNIVYENPEFGVPTGFLTEGDISGQPLIRAMGLDKLNIQLDPTPDGVFDFIDGATTTGGTIQSSNGRIFFPTIEPFGSDLRKAIDPSNPSSNLAYKYSYDSLYTQTKQQARQYPDKNRFAMEGRYKSAAGSDISLNTMQVPQGSVKVTAGGVPLRENVDYTVDYTLGRVKIINEGILNSGTPINISLESNSMFAIQSKTMLGAHVDYDFNKDFRIGATVMNLTERPLTQKVNTGDEPISNTIWGLDGNYQSQSLLLTKLIDKIPFIETKAPSKVSITGEFAHFIPGHPRAIGKSGVSYIDDFEGSSSNTDLKSLGKWFLASVPRGQVNFGMFPESGFIKDTIAIGFNRASLAWYQIDPLFSRNNNLTPDHIKNDKDAQSNHYVREIFEREVFPNKEQTNNIPTSLAVLNLSFYPSERGPYNFDVQPTAFSQGLASNGKLNNPETRWGGIMREFEMTDFQSLNFEYIEFWVMDPFIDPDGSGPKQAMQNGGNLYFNIGDISEDVLRDGRKSFENGLPISNTLLNVDSTIWGLVPKIQALTPFFDNNNSSRPFQDVGYDGLSDDNERTFYQTAYLDRIANLYGTGSQAYLEANSDPSADNYHFFRGSDYDNVQLSVTERYKKYNRSQGNSPTADQDNESYSTLSTTAPNVEDINGDYTLSEEERYYQYKIELRPDKMEVGTNYITDMYTAPVTLPNKSHANVKWYLFRIPVTQPDLVVGQISDFNSIRFMRIFLKDFSEEAHLRFATMDLVKNEWRKYSNELLEPGEYIPDDQQNGTSFEVSRVNIEENGKRIPVPYVLPPGIDREVNYASTNLTHLNEQSLVLKVCNLVDGDARAAYKTTEFDFRRYKKLKMYVHAEQSQQDKQIANGDLRLFVRLGTDFTENYYEYEVPLTLTPWGTALPESIWPDANAIELELGKLLDAKQQRNIDIREGTNNNITMYTPYSVMDGKNRITIKGTPTLSSVKTIMVGVRNPKKGNSTVDDGMEKCAEIWVNEFRVSDFDEHSGAAANVVVAADLADFGNIVIAGNMSTNGFGSIEKKIGERQQESILGYDIATNLELGKFFKEESGLRVPMHFDFSEIYKKPEFNPLNPDIKYNDDLSTFKDNNERDSIRKISEDYTRRASFNLMNVKKMRVGATKKPRIYDIENFDVSYSYSSIFHRNIDIEYDSKKQYKGALGYTYANTPKNVMPFGKSKFLSKHKSFALIRDFNFFYLPKQLGFRTDIDRMYNESLMRKKTKSLIIIDPTFVKTFAWNRNYDLRYDFSNSLKFDYTAAIIARVDEPAGVVDRNNDNWENMRDSIIMSIKDMGRITSFNQVYNVNYAIPINKIPLLNWITANATYGGTYVWLSAPLSTTHLGNTIENSNKIQLNGTANFVNLYNKIGYLKKLNTDNRQNNLQGGQRLRIPPSEEAAAKDTVLKKPSIAKLVFDNTLKILMGVKNASISYTEANGSFMPGFTSSPGPLGMNWANNAPGWDFIFGSQTNIAERSANNGWLTKSSMLNNAFVRKHNVNINGRVSIEPIKSLRVEITFLRTINNISQEYWRYDTIDYKYKAFSPTETGNFSISYGTIRTSIAKDDKKTFDNKNFTTLKSNLLIVANRLAQENSNWLSNPLYIRDSLTGIMYPDGYSATNSDVLLYAFLSAYSGENASTIPLTPFPKIPKPNWRITYNGLTDIPFIRRYFKTVSVSHAYTSTYSIGGFSNNILYRETDDGMAYVRDQLGKNYLPKFDMNMIAISEQFSPLINIDMTLENSLVAKFAIRTTRNLALSFSNYQMTEMKSNEVIIGTGYRFKDIPLRLSFSGNQKTFKSDINVKLDFSIRSNTTILRRILENINQASAGIKVISINFSADYQFSQRVTFRVFYDHIINNPIVNNQYRNSNINAGISIRFSLAN